ncbi:unnamed protein product [Urochloa humidicola]
MSIPVDPRGYPTPSPQAGKESRSRRVSARLDPARVASPVPRGTAAAATATAASSIQGSSRVVTATADGDGSDGCSLNNLESDRGSSYRERSVKLFDTCLSSKCNYKNQQHGFDNFSSLIRVSCLLG